MLLIYRVNDLLQTTVPSYNYTAYLKDAFARVVIDPCRVTIYGIPTSMDDSHLPNCYPKYLHVYLYISNANLTYPRFLISWNHVTGRNSLSYSHTSRGPWPG